MLTPRFWALMSEFPKETVLRSKVKCGTSLDSFSLTPKSVVEYFQDFDPKIWGPSVKIARRAKLNVD